MEIPRKCKAPGDKVQHTKTVTLINLHLELPPLVNIENSHFYYALVFALYYYEITQKCKAPWVSMQNLKTVTLVNLLLELRPFEHRRYWN